MVENRKFKTIPEVHKEFEAQLKALIKGAIKEEDILEELKVHENCRFEIEDKEILATAISKEQNKVIDKLFKEAL